jgi:hypothetical protein
VETQKQFKFTHILADASAFGKVMYVQTCVLILSGNTERYNIKLFEERFSLI